MTSGLSTADFAVVDNTELNAAIRRNEMQQRARFPIQLVGFPYSTALPLTDEERGQLRAMVEESLRTTLDAPPWQYQGAGEYWGVRVLDPLVGGDNEEHSRTPVLTILDVYDGTIRCSAPSGTTFHPDPGRKLEGWALSLVLSRTDAEDDYARLSGNKPQ